MIRYDIVFFFQAEDGIRDLVRSRGLGDVYKRQGKRGEADIALNDDAALMSLLKDAWAKYDGTDASVKLVVTDVLAYDKNWKMNLNEISGLTCLLYTSDAADERSSVDLGGRRIIKKKKTRKYTRWMM